MDEYRKENVKVLKELSKGILPIWCFYMVLYIIWVITNFPQNGILQGLMVLFGPISGAFMHSTLNRFITFEVSYKLEIKYAILINVLFILFLPLLMYITIDPFFFIIWGDKLGHFYTPLFLICYFFTSFFAEVIFAFVGISEGHRSAIMSGKYDYKILRKLGCVESKN